MATRGARSNSMGWGRLKAPNLDYLESMGLPSKGEKRLLNPKTQETYYTKIVERFMSFCSDAGRGDELLRRLAQLEISNNPSVNSLFRNSTSNTMPSNASTQNDLSILMMSMRKLREGIVASNRVDDFSIQAYLFCIRFSIHVKHWESFQPPLLHLLKRMNRILPLSNTELQEFAGYLVLDLACRQNNLTEAYSMRQKYGLRDAKVDSVLRALTHDNYHLFWSVKKSVDGYKAKLMEYAEEGMKRQALKCLGQSYHTIDLPSLEQYTNSSWIALTTEQGVGWELDGSKVTIRKLKVR